MAKRAGAQKVEGEMEGIETEIAMGDCVVGDLERLGEEWKNIDRRNLRLLTE